MVLLGSSARAEPADQLESFEALTDRIAEQGFTGDILETTMVIMFGETSRADPEKADVVGHWRERIAALSPNLSHAVRGVVQREDATPLLGEITAPTLVISGREDVPRPPDWSDALVAGIPGAELWRLEGIGHSPILEAPDVVVPRVLEFLSGSAGAVRPESVADLRELLGRELGPTDWWEVTQERIDAFADATGDHQWIHVDPARAADSPLGTTIAHGLLTLSLGPKFMEELMAFDGFAHSLNYGYAKVRFPAPVPVGSRVRMRATITDVADVSGGAQVTTTQVIEREGSEKPVCVAESIGRFVEKPVAAHA